MNLFILIDVNFRWRGNCSKMFIIMESDLRCVNKELFKKCLTEVVTIFIWVYSYFRGNFCTLVQTGWFQSSAYPAARLPIQNIPPFKVEQNNVFQEAVRWFAEHNEFVLNVFVESSMMPQFIPWLTGRADSFSKKFG